MAEKSPETRSKEVDSVKAMDSNRAATLVELFSFADVFDVICMFVGSLASIASGCSLPIFCILFGTMLDTLNKGGSIKDAVDKVVIDFVVIAALNLLVGFLQVCNFKYSTSAVDSYFFFVFKSLRWRETSSKDACKVCSINFGARSGLV